MILIQHINVFWHKKERAPEFTRARLAFMPAWHMDDMPESDCHEVLLNNLNFYQDGNIFRNSMQQKEYIWQNIKGGNIELSDDQVSKRLIQDKLYLKKNEYQLFTSIGNVNIANLSFKMTDAACEITFHYDEGKSGKPVRRGHNKDFTCPQSPLYCCDILNETAFVLKAGQYGRIVYNERRTDYDTGDWYYQLHTINIANSQNDRVEANVFVDMGVDFEYKQLAKLY